MRGRFTICDLRFTIVRATLWLSLGGLVMQAVAQEEGPKLQPPLGEIPPTFWEQHGLTVILAAGGIILFIVLGVWFWLQPKPVAVLSPEEVARRELDALSKRPEDGEVISRASQILRQYVLGVFELPAGQPTTAEFCKLIGRSDKVGNELSTSLADFLRHCDERKFAKSGSIVPLNAAARALELVKQGEARHEQLRQNATTEGGKPVARAA
jgi:hypothetical protein